MKAIVDTSMSRQLMQPAMAGDEDGRDGHEQAAWHREAEYWAKRAMWLLVAVTSLWDIAVTFDRHVELTARLF